MKKLLILLTAIIIGCSAFFTACTETPSEMTNQEISSVYQEVVMQTLSKLGINAPPQIGAYLEFYEFFTDGVLAGVPDYVPKEIVDGEVTVSPEAFGLLAQGILNVSKVKEGKLTMCRLTTENGKYVMHMVVGEGKNPGRWEEAGWAQPAPQLPALKVCLNDTEDFAQKIMCQHYIISYGDNSEIIKEFCQIAGIEII